jgi:hypothetical protein
MTTEIDASLRIIVRVITFLAIFLAVESLIVEEEVPYRIRNERNERFEKRVSREQRPAMC